MFYLIGLGLDKPENITLEGKKAIEQSNKIYLENYTNLGPNKETLQSFFNKEIIEAPRKLVEEQLEPLLEEAKKNDIALLIIGDVYAATTHQEIRLAANKQGTPFKAIHNVSIINAITETGLDLYKFGRTTTIVYPQKNYNPTSYYEAIEENKQRGLHSLCLLDIKKEEERYMTVQEAIERLLLIAEEQGGSINKETPMIGCARITSKEQTIIYGTANQLLHEEFGKPPHCLVIPGTLNVIEEEAIQQIKK